jgi:hypothetical protein
VAAAAGTQRDTEPSEWPIAKLPLLLPLTSPHDMLVTRDVLLMTRITTVVFSLLLLLLLTVGIFATHTPTPSTRITSTSLSLKYLQGTRDHTHPDTTSCIHDSPQTIHIAT